MFFNWNRNLFQKSLNRSVPSSVHVYMHACGLVGVCEQALGHSFMLVFISHMAELCDLFISCREKKHKRVDSTIVFTSIQLASMKSMLLFRQLKFLQLFFLRLGVVVVAAIVKETE